MTFGAFFWGSYSDSKGRKIPYTMTLMITTLFGLLSSFTFSFGSLCFTLFFLGFGVGGNMPTDGALYLEFLPKEYHYLLTFMSVFFSFGAVLASILGYLILPTWSCPEDGLPCDMSKQNNGWRILLFAVAFITFIMLLLRSLWLKLPETPKFLMSQDRANETIIVLQDIAKINGGTVQIHQSELPQSRKSSPVIEEEEDILEEDDEGNEITHMLPTNNSTGTDIKEQEEEEQIKAFKLLLGPKWRLTTLLIWTIWTVTSVAYTMFNVFLPKFLETLGFEGEAMPTRQQVYWDYMIYSIAGVPGSVVSLYL
jgi:MFS family permease